MYEVLFTEYSIKQLKKLEKHVQKRILSTLQRIRIRPEHFIKKLVGSPYYKLRVGDYRVILDVNKGKLIILIINIGHRKKVYKHLFRV